MMNFDKSSIVETLWKRAKYAVHSYSKSLIYQTLGAIDMAVELGAVSRRDICDIQFYLVHDHLNNGIYMESVYNRSALKF